MPLQGWWGGEGVGGEQMLSSNSPGHLWRDKWTALSGPLSGGQPAGPAPLQGAVPYPQPPAISAEGGDTWTCSPAEGPSGAASSVAPPSIGSSCSTCLRVEHSGFGLAFSIQGSACKGGVFGVEG